ncbi:MAG: hypothetical protein H0U73_10510 [Tatlockia sp.]|nr:hypothetical protein [Tatlockia sp.]
MDKAKLRVSTDLLISSNDEILRLEFNNKPKKDLHEETKHAKKRDIFFNKKNTPEEKLKENSISNYSP